VYEGVIEALKVADPEHGVSMEVKHQLIINAIDVLTESAQKDIGGLWNSSQIVSNYYHSS